MAPGDSPLCQRPIIFMAKSQFKAGGPTRGRKRVRKLGMGAGKHTAKVRAQKKG
jgi:hypothetical protein